MHGWELINAAGWSSRQYLWCNCPGEGVRCSHVAGMVKEGAQLLRAAGELDDDCGVDREALKNIAWCKYFPLYWNDCTGITGYIFGFGHHWHLVHDMPSEDKNILSDFLSSFFSFLWVPGFDNISFALYSALLFHVGLNYSCLLVPAAYKSSEIRSKYEKPRYSVRLCKAKNGAAG